MACLLHGRRTGIPPECRAINKINETDRYDAPAAPATDAQAFIACLKEAAATC